MSGGEVRAPGVSDGLAMEGLRTDQAPPLSIPARFFLLGTVAMFAAGALLLDAGPAALWSRWLPVALAGTHLGTLGFLGSIMVGALYQMTPVVAGAPVPAPRLAHAVHAAWALGTAALAVGLATGHHLLLGAAPALLGGALLAFLAPTGLALSRAPTRSETVDGMRLAVGGLTAIGTLGVLLAIARTTGRSVLGGDWSAWVAAHATLGGLVWIGGLIAAVSWQVIPMFYLAPPLPAWSRRATLAAVAVTLVAAPLAAALGAGPTRVAAGAAPAAVLVWLVHPLVAARAIRRRRRRRADASLRFWWAGLACGPVAFVLAVGATFGDHPRWSVALGWVVVWGWAGLIAHGMLGRIVPFLVWFHRFSSLVGRVPVPSMRDLLPERRIRLAFGLHVGAVAAGALALLAGSAPLARIAGLLLALAGAVLAANLVHVLRRHPAPQPALPQPGDRALS